MQYSAIFYGGKSGIEIDKVDIGKVLEGASKYLEGKKLQAQGIKMPGAADAIKMVKKAAQIQKLSRNSPQVKDLGFTPELRLVGGIDIKGNLSVTVTGLLPPSEPGKPPIKFEKTTIIRKDWAKLEKELSSDKNVVVNLTKSNLSIVEAALDKLLTKHGGDIKKMKADKMYAALVAKFADGDKVINKAAERQAKKFKTTEMTTAQADFGDLKSGTVVLAAHGSRVKVSGITLGTALGKKSPEEIVKLLTEQKDKKKNLSKKFNGTVLLSGCFTAAGGIAPPGKDYDYDTFAGKVWRLLKAKGINCKVSGMPGQARTGADGDKSSVKPTEQDAYDALKREFKSLQANLKKQEKKLKSGDKNAVKAANKEIALLLPKLRKVGADKESKVMKKLIMNYGLDPVR